MRFLDAGESHGRALVAIVEGMPSNMDIDASIINYELKKRQCGFGRGGRMKIESDTVDILTGVRNGKTTGAPITLIINNKDYNNWERVINNAEAEKVLCPRPGHADLNGALKYNFDDIRNVIERSSARETAIRTAVGALASIFLKKFGIYARSRVIQIGLVKDNTGTEGADFNFAENSETMCSDLKYNEAMISEINSARDKGDTLGGRFEVVISNVPVGVGSYAQWDRRLDARLASAIMSIQGIKAVEIGNGEESAGIYGSKFHDEIFYSQDRGYYRKTNNAGGIEGGISGGEDVIIRASMKPIPTLKVPLMSVDIESKNGVSAAFERSDVCAVPSASIVGRNACMWEIACAMGEKFGGDSMEEITSNYRQYLDYLHQR